MDADIMNPDVSAGLGDKDDRRRRLTSAFVRYPRFTCIVEAFVERVEFSRATGTADSVLIVGRSGVGKTTLVEQLLLKYPALDTPERTFKPLIHASIPPAVTLKGLVASLLRAVGDPAAHHGVEQAMTDRLYGYLEKCQVLGVVLDEFQHLIYAKTDTTQRNAGDWIKILADRRPVFLAGMPESREALDKNEQLARRFSAIIELRPFEWTRKGEEFCRFLYEYENLLPFRDRAQFADEHLAMRFFVASAGIVAHVVKIVRSAGNRAINEELQNIPLDFLADAYDREIGGAKNIVLNPFRAPIDKVAKEAEAFEQRPHGKGMNRRIKGVGRKPDRLGDVL